ncbi:MAG: phenylalanine--tRNA ligase subunit beta [bacterium]
MNILTSYDWIKEYLDTKATPEEFARELSLRGPGVEKIFSTADSFKDIIVGKILKIEPHPNADKLRLVEVDLGEKQETIVCGGTNLAPDQLVAVALLGAKVRWHGAGELVTLASAEIRGVKSNGMICGADEIGLGDLFPHAEKEILDLTASRAEPGSSVAEALGLEDPIFDIEATTNRPDAFGIKGLAREAAAAGLGRFTDKTHALKLQKGDNLKVTIEEPNLCARYLAATVRGLKVGPSPTWMKVRLHQAGIRPINNIVDITNYVLLELGQPLHAFDRSKVEGDTIVVRKAAENEEFLALDGKTYQLNENNLVIADTHRPVAIAGVMGGEESGVSAETISIVLEAANFEPVSVRKTSRGLNLMSDSSLRFEKGLSPEAPEEALAFALELLKKILPEAEVTQVLDVRAKPYETLKFPFRPEYAASLIGEEIPKEEMKKILEALGFEVSAKGNKWLVTVPYWRDHDIESERDLVEEVARVYGYHRLNSRLPEGEPSTREQDPILFWTDELKRFHEGLGWTEVYNYSYVNREQYKKLGRGEAELYAVSNPLTSDQTHLRDSLLPGVLTVIAENQNRFPAGKLYELGTVFGFGAGTGPLEKSEYLAVAYGYSDDQAYFDLKGLLEGLEEKYGLQGLALGKLDPEIDFLHPGRGAVIKKDGKIVGAVGELHPAIQGAYKLDKRAGVLTLDLDATVNSLTLTRSFKGIPEFPSVFRDVSFIVPRRTSHLELITAVTKIDPTIVGMEKFDEFHGPEIGADKKSLAYHLEFRSNKKTLSAEEADELFAQVAGVLKAEFRALIRV